MVHLLQVTVRIDNREYRFEGRSAPGAALVVAFRDWLATVPAVAAVEADTLEQEVVVWSGEKERKGTAEVQLGSDLLQSTLDLSKAHE